VKTLPELKPDAPIKPPLRHHRHWRKIILISFSILIVLVGGAGVALYKYANSKLDGGDIKNLRGIDPIDPGGAQNILIIGSDTRDGLDKREKSLPAFFPSGGKRSDTIILVHLFADKQHAVVMSFPRDLRVNVPGYGLTKINAAYNLGPENVIKTVKEYSGLPINHYVEVNFIAFRRIVNALGGVPMCVTHPYNDPDAGLFIKKAGCYNFDGDQALGFARTRKQDPRGDFDRIDHQQQLIRVMLQKVTSLGILLKPWKILDIADAVGDSLLHDKDFDVRLAYGLAGRLKGGSTTDTANQRVDFREIPSYPAYIGGISYVLPKPDETRALLDAIKADKWPLPEFGKTAASIPQRKDVTVRVYDASGRAGVAKAIHEKLKKLGFDVKIIIKKSPVILPKTQIWFRHGDELKAKLVDDELTAGDVMSGDKADTDADVTIYVGADAGGEPPPSPSG
jgi:LCP family protein required for cell wall assembly